MDDDKSYSTIAAQIEAVRRDYHGEREKLETLLSQSYREPSSTADTLLSTSEEYGREHAMELLTTRPRDFGDQDAQLPAEAIEYAEQMLERMEVLHDRLDELTVERDAPERRDDRRRTINIQGDEYALDGQRRAYKLQPEAERELSATQKMANELEIERDPSPRHVPGRSRSR